MEEGLYGLEGGLPNPGEVGRRSKHGNDIDNNDDCCVESTHHVSSVPDSQAWIKEKWFKDPIWIFEQYQAYRHRVLAAQSRSLCVGQPPSVMSAGQCRMTWIHHLL